MRVVVLNTDYDDFLRAFYSTGEGLAEASFESQMQARADSLFGVADFYSRSLCELGHEAIDVTLNNHAAQAAWAREHGLEAAARGLVAGSRRGRFARGAFRAARSLGAGGRSLRQLELDVLEAQLSVIRPDVLLNQTVDSLDAGQLRRLRRDVGMIVGQVAWLSSAGPAGSDPERLLAHDVIVSSARPTVERLESLGVRSYLWRLAFDPRVNAEVPARPRQHDVTFVGGLTGVHAPRVALLEALADAVPQLRVWTSSVAHLPRTSPLHGCYAGPAWGRAMYEVLASSRITINDQAPVAPYANNLRLFEATGMGTLVLTNDVDGLDELFEPGTELGVFSTAGEAVELVSRYLVDDGAREGIARAGHERTLASHTYRSRMTEFVDLVESIAA